jgi:hypothetical protein
MELCDMLFSSYVLYEFFVVPEDLEQGFLGILFFWPLTVIIQRSQEANLSKLEAELNLSALGGWIAKIYHLYHSLE